jgi:hypothetical protein
VLASRAASGQTTGPLQLLDVPFVSQSEDLCGGAAAAMVLRYWGERGIDAQAFAPLVDRSRAGIPTGALLSTLVQRGWHAAGVQGSDAMLRSEIAAGRPVIALIEDGPGRDHYVVIVAAGERAIVFHDPARSPFRVMTPREFDERWSATGRWMAVVTPGADSTSRTSSPPPSPASGLRADASSCDALVAEGVALARDSKMADAEERLTRALECPGPAARRELAGVRLLQGRLADAESLAQSATADDPRDEYLWRLLGTVKFLLDDQRGALRAWNAIGEPSIDLVRIDGLTRTRQRVVEQLVGVRAGRLLTPGALLQARRRLADLPSAFSSRVDFTPVPSGQAELHATLAEREVLPHSRWDLLSLGISAAADREVRATTGSFTGGGESLTADWRFWPDRPRGAMRFAAPAPWGGIWSVEASTERQPFSRDGARVPESGAAAIDSVTRTTAMMSAAAWVTPVVRLGARGGLDRWDSPSTATDATIGGFAELASANDRLRARVDVDLWTGSDRSFASTTTSVGWRSSTAHTGRVWIGDAGVSLAADGTPLGSWFAGDTGHARSTLLRAHPLLDAGGLRVERLGRTLVHVSGETQQWWTVGSVLHVGAAVFADEAVTARRFTGARLDDVDVGAGVRMAAPLLPGVIRLDVAKGVRDGATALSIVYAP